MFIQVTFTCGTKEEAGKIARSLVEQRFAACVQIVGEIASVYRWQGKIEEEKEWLCIAKTSRSKYSEVEATIINLHTYETPEIIATEITDGSKAYLQWLNAELISTQDTSEK